MTNALLGKWRREVQPGDGSWLNASGPRRWGLGHGYAASGLPTRCCCSGFDPEKLHDVGVDCGYMFGNNGLVCGGIKSKKLNRMEFERTDPEVRTRLEHGHNSSLNVLDSSKVTL